MFHQRTAEDYFTCIRAHLNAEQYVAAGAIRRVANGAQRVTPSIQSRVGQRLGRFPLGTAASEMPKCPQLFIIISRFPSSRNRII